jgi:uncharacterized protein Usg
MNPILIHPRCRLVLALIDFRLPDHPKIIQEFIFQKHDIVPELPELQKFLEFWEREIEGPIKQVRVSYPGLKIPRSIRIADCEYAVH